MAYYILLYLSKKLSKLFAKQIRKVYIDDSDNPDNFHDFDDAEDFDNFDDLTTLITYK